MRPVVIGLPWILLALAAPPAVELNTVGEVPPAVIELVRAELEQTFAEKLEDRSAPELLSVTLAGGAKNVRFIAVRKSNGASMELDLGAGRRTFRPALDELVLRLFPDRAKRTPAPPAAVAPPSEASSIDVAPFIAGGATAGMFAAALALGASGSRGAEMLGDRPLGSAAYRDAQDSVETRMFAANVLFISAAVGAVLTVALALDE